MSLRRSARARVPASDPDAVVTATTPASAEKQRKRTRSTMTPETSQSPGKAGSPTSDGQQDTTMSSSPSMTRPSTRKIVVRSSRTGQKPQAQAQAQSDVTSENAPPAPNGNGVLLDLESEDDAGEREELRELYMGEEDKKKLETVLRVYAAEVLTQRIEHQTGRKQARQTLEQVLSQPKCSIRGVRAHLLAIRAPLTSTSALRAHLSSSHVAPPKDEVDKDRRKLSTLTMILAVVDEIASRAKVEAGKVDVEESPAKAGRGESEYALSMRLPSGDYFTNAVRLSNSEALQLDTGYSKLVSIATQPLSKEIGPPPTLGERLGRRSGKRKAGTEFLLDSNTEQDTAKPVSHLYYGPWSSFAPSYDSFDGNLNLQASCALWRAKSDDQRVLLAMAEEPSSYRQQLEQAMATLEDVDAEVVMRAYDDLPSRDSTSLESSAQLIERLDELQAQRWKRAFARRLAKKRSSKADDEDASTPSQEERAVAADILDTLTALLSTHAGSLAEIVPATSALHAASQSVCIDPALVDGKGESGYWGSLNETLYGPSATRRVPGARSAPVKPPAAIRDNETIRMESVHDEKISAAMTQAAPAIKGKGLLDRFATARNYSVEDHPHDRKLVVAPTPPTAAQARPSLPPSQSSYRTAMSPPSATSPGRPYPQQMKPAPGTPTTSYMQSQPQQQPASGKTANYGQYRPATAQSPRGWPQPQQGASLYPSSPYHVGRPPSAQDHRFLSGSPS